MFLVLMDQRSKWLMTRLPLPRMQQACEFVGSDGAFSELSFVAEAFHDGRQQRHFLRPAQNTWPVLCFKY